MTDNNEDKRQQLIEETKESYEAEKEQQQELKEAVASEHKGEVIETPVTLAGDVTATVHTRLTGELLDRMAHIEQTAEAVQDGDAKASDAPEIADSMAQLLADTLKEDHFNKSYFYEIYRETGLEAIGALFEEVATAIEDEQKRRQGAVDGFRQQ